MDLVLLVGTLHLALGRLNELLLPNLRAGQAACSRSCCGPPTAYDLSVNRKGSRSGLLLGTDLEDVDLPGRQSGLIVPLGINQ